MKQSHMLHCVFQCVSAVPYERSAYNGQSHQSRRTCDRRWTGRLFHGTESTGVESKRCDGRQGTGRKIRPVPKYYLHDDFDPKKSDLGKWLEEGSIADEYLENRDWVEIVCRKSKARWDDMEKWGMQSWRYDANGDAYLVPINESDDERCSGEPDENIITNDLIENRYHSLDAMKKVTQAEEAAK